MLLIFNFVLLRLNYNHNLFKMHTRPLSNCGPGPNLGAIFGLSLGSTLRPMLIPVYKGNVRKYKGKLTVICFGHNFLCNHLIFLIPSPDCCICLYFSVDTPHRNSFGHFMAVPIWPNSYYGHILPICPYLDSHKMAK